MKPYVALVCGLCAMAMVPVGSYAATVTYSTTGIFTSTGTNTLPVGSGDLVFNDLGPTTVTEPSNISFGFFDSGSIDGGGTIPGGTAFTLTINQIGPVAGSATAGGTLSGFINATQSTVALLFATTSFTIDGTVYTITQPPGGILVVPPSSNGGITTIQGTVAAAAVPEPATCLGIGTALVVLAFSMRFRRSRA